MTNMVRKLAEAGPAPLTLKCPTTVSKRSFMEIVGGK